jgi:hypothetical protein
MAEIELNVMTRQCLSRRIESIETLGKQLDAWEKDRNKTKDCISWQFTARDSRLKLKSLYPLVRTETGYARI